MPKLTVSKPTRVKREPVDSSSLSEADFIDVEIGREFYFVDHEPTDNGHVKITFAPNKGWPEGYFYIPHIEGVVIEGNVEGNQPNDKAETKEENRGQLFRVPGIGEVYANDPILGAGGNFKYYEAFRRDGHRIPTSSRLAQDVLKGAQMMEDIRAKLGGVPLTVTSWHRPPLINRAVGGASRSQHVLSCSSVDFYPHGMSVEEAYRILNPWWGGRGGLARKPGSFLHCDLRGYWARWVY